MKALYLKFLGFAVGAASGMEMLGEGPDEFQEAMVKVLPSIARRFASCDFPDKRAPAMLVSDILKLRRMDQ